MPSDVSKLYELPEISFIDDITAMEVKEELFSDFDSMREEITGETSKLNENSVYGTLLNASCLKIYQAMQYIDRAGKMNLLKYSTGDFLKNIIALRGIIPTGGKKATCIARFSISEEQDYAVPIEKGTRITSGDGMYFETVEYAEIPQNQKQIDIEVACMEAGNIGNKYGAGKLNILADPFPYADSVSNITAASGGIDEDSDEDLKEKTFLAPSGYSTTGTEDSYAYWCKQYDSTLQDIKIKNPEGTEINIILVCKDGNIPDENYLSGLEKFLKENKRNPTTDRITTRGASAVDYDIDITYYINRGDKSNVELLKNNIQNAVDTYIAWQKEKIGRDLNPDYLKALVIMAGAKRVSINSPQFADIDDASIAQLKNVSVNYGGMEDD